MHIIVSFSVIENVTKLLTISSNRFASLDTLQVLLSLLIFPINSLGLTRMHLPKEYRHMDGLIRLEMVANNDHWTNQIPGLWFDGFVFVL